MNLPKRILGELMRGVAIAICAIAFAVSIAEQTAPDIHDGGAVSHLLVSEHGQAPRDTPGTPSDHSLHVDHCAHGHAALGAGAKIEDSRTQIASVFPLVPGMPIELSLSPETPPPIA